MKRPEISKQSKGISLSYGVSPTSETKNYVPTISPEEDNQIRQWVNENYALYGDDYRMAAYRDAQQAVLDRKATVERKAILERERKERAEKAAYEGDDRTLNEQKQLARAENAINDAATLIRQGQEANGIKVDKTLTDKETVDKFLEANLEMPYAEYVNKFLDSQSNGGYYNNEWLAAKFGLNEKEKSVNRRDKFEAGVKGYAQGLADIAQNTFGGAAEYLGSNIAAGIGEGLYGIADFLGADTSEGSVWDKMKKAKGYTWKEAQDAASSEDMWKEGTLSEDAGAFGVGRNLGQATTEIALTAPLEAGVGSAIKAGQIGMKTVQLSKPVKAALQTANLLGGGAAFQLADDAANGEWSNWAQYAKTSGLNAATAGLFSVMGKLAPKKIGYTLFAPKGQNQTALLTQSAEDWAKKTNINKAYAKDINAAKTPYTEIANDLEKTAEQTLGGRLEEGAKLGNVRAFDLKFKKGGRYDAKKALKTDINEALMDLANKKRFGNLAGDKELIPQFSFTKNGLEVSNPDVLNKIYREETTRDGGTKLVKLWDEVKNVYAQTYGGGAKVNAATTEEFLRGLDRVFGKKGWIGGPNNLTALMKEGIENATKKFESSLTEQSLTALNKARKSAEKAIGIDENLNKVLGVLRNTDMVGKVGAAEKVLGGKAQMQQLFKEINDKYGIDMNNEILAWAYNMSLYDVKKAQQILDTFYPSTPGLIEAVLRVITKAGRRSAANKLVEGGKEYVESMNKYSTKPIVGGEFASTLSTRTNLMGENTRGEED